jgi:arylsulfatase A-like enzyme
MTRRDYLKRAAAFAAAPVIAQARRPNILLALADDWGWPFASITGEPVVETPVFDRVARNGARFTNAFVSAPSCSPSRAAILTGQWHWRLEEGANLGGTLASKFPVYPDLLESAGYHVGFSGKGWSPGDEAPGGRKRNPAGPRFDDLSSFLAARPKGAPFCFWFGSTDPHRPYERGSGVNSGMRWQEVRVPAYLPDHETVRRDICDYFLEVQRFDRETGELLAMIEKAGELENTLVVMTGDNGWPFPRSKATLYDAGTHVPLALSWPARLQGGRTIEDFVSLSDLAPTFLEAAGVRSPHEITARSLLPLKGRDHVLTGMERHVPCRGEIRGGYPMRAIRTQDFLYIRNFQPDRWPAGDPSAQKFSFEELATETFKTLADIDASPTKAHMCLHKQDTYEFAAGKRPERELYDIRKDPFQLRNVAGAADHAGVAKRLDAQLMAELKASGDPRTGGGGDQFDRYVWYQGRQMEKKP